MPSSPDFSNFFSLSTQPVAIFPDAYMSTLTVKNSGPDEIYLGTASTLNSVSGFPLGAGSSIQWDAGRPLYALGSSTASSVLVMSNQGNVFDASAVASQILAQGLAHDIASQIAISGAPSINKSELHDFTFQIASFNVMPPVVFVDCSQYHELNVYVNETYTPPATPANPYPNSARIYTVTWYDASSQLVGLDSFASLPSRNFSNVGVNATLARIPIRGEQFTLTFTPVFDDSTTKPLLTLYATMSTSPCDTITVDQGMGMANSDPAGVSNVSGGNGLGSYHCTLSPAPLHDPVYDYPAFRSGQGTVAFHINSLANGQAVTFNLADMISRAGFLQHTFTGPLDDTKTWYPVTLPRVPLNISADLVGGTSLVNVGFTLISP